MPSREVRTRVSKYSINRNLQGQDVNGKFPPSALRMFLIHVLLQDNRHWLFHAEIDPKWGDRLLVKQHGGNLGKCAYVGSALWDAVL
jgi:hypothetical protein